MAPGFSALKTMADDIIDDDLNPQDAAENSPLEGQEDKDGYIELEAGKEPHNDSDRATSSEQSNEGYIELKAPSQAAHQARAQHPASKKPAVQSPQIPKAMQVPLRPIPIHSEHKKKFKKHPMHYQKSEFHKSKEEHREEQMHAQDMQASQGVGKNSTRKGLGKFFAKREKTQEQREPALAGRESPHPHIIGFIDNIYHNEYKKLLFFTIGLILISICIIFAQLIMTGDYVQKGVTLKGGISVTIDVPAGTTIDTASLQARLQAAYVHSDISVRELSQGGIQQGVTIEATDVEATDVLNTLYQELPAVPKIAYSAETTGSSLGASFFKQTELIVLVALLCMAIVVFAYFRVPIPSIAIMLAAISTAITTLGVIDLIGLKLSTAGVAAFLMLLGYSIDTDIVLSVRVLKRKEGTIYDRTLDAMKTGLTMTITALAAALVSFFLTQSEVIKEIMLVLIIGLTCDIIYTWIQNAAILRWYLEKHPGAAMKH